LTDRQRDTFYLVPCPECDKYIEYTIDVKIDYLYRMTAEEDIDSKMKQAAKAAAAEHNNKVIGHTASLFEYKVIGASEAEKEIARKEKVDLLNSILSFMLR
jgi:hypothetical protein